MNIWGTRGDWSRRREVLRRELGALRPDLLTLQETMVTDRYDQVRDLLGDDYQVIHQRDREPDGQGVSLVSRWPVGRVEELDLNVSERTADFACTALLAELDSPVGRLVLVNHFPSWKLDMEAEREAQAVLVARAVERIMREREVPVILAGDLDADPSAASVRFLTGRQSLHGLSVCYRDAWDSVHPDDTGHTYTPVNPLMVEDWPFRRIDYILVRCGEHGGPMLAVADCRRLFDHAVDRVWASDHFGLVADLVPHRVRSAQLHGEQRAGASPGS